MQTLSKRLEIIAEKIPKGVSVCDVGTDHAYLPIYLALSGEYGKITATDIRKKPLENARKNVEMSGVNGVRLLLCDGLQKVGREDADAVIVAGMGGEVISGIIDRTPFLKQGVTLILQPMTAASELREYLCRNGFEITEETPVLENGKLYSVMSAVYTAHSFECDGAFALIGKIDTKTELGRAYAQKQLRICSDVLKSLDASQYSEKYGEFSETRNTLLKVLEE